MVYCDFCCGVVHRNIVYVSVIYGDDCEGVYGDFVYCDVVDYCGGVVYCDV